MEYVVCLGLCLYITLENLTKSVHRHRKVLSHIVKFTCSCLKEEKYILADIAVR